MRFYVCRCVVVVLSASGLRPLYYVDVCANTCSCNASARSCVSERFISEQVPRTVLQNRAAHPTQSTDVR
jgi:hypothetical protein